MAATTLSVENIPATVQTLLKLEVVSPTSPLLRGDPPPTHLIQVVKRRADGSLYELSYRQPSPGEITISE
jgi:hypothetical protein